MRRRALRAAPHETEHRVGIEYEGGSPFLDDGGRLPGASIAIRGARPIEAAEAFRESEARLRALSSLDDLVFELDVQGVYMAVWTTSDRLLVSPRRDLLGRTVREALGEEVGGRVTRAIGRALKTGNPEMVEYRLEVPADAGGSKAGLPGSPGWPIQTSVSSCATSRTRRLPKRRVVGREEAPSSPGHP